MRRAAVPQNAAHAGAGQECCVMTALGQSPAEVGFRVRTHLQMGPKLLSKVLKLINNDKNTQKIAFLIRLKPSSVNYFHMS